MESFSPTEYVGDENVQRRTHYLEGVDCSAEPMTFKLQHMRVHVRDRLERGIKEKAAVAANAAMH